MTALTQMNSLMTELNEDFTGLYTIRLTPSKFKEYLQDCQILERIQILTEEFALDSILVFGEGQVPHSRHFHIRLRKNTWSTAKSPRDAFHRHFPEVKGIGNAAMSLHVCRDKDKSPLHSATYCAKEADLHFSLGYDVETLAKFIKIGKKMKSWKNIPPYRQIIGMYDLTDDSAGHEILYGIEQYYHNLGKPPPPHSTCRRLIHNIAYTISKAYQRKFREDMIKDFAYITQVWGASQCES